MTGRKRASEEEAKQEEGLGEARYSEQPVDPDEERTDASGRVLHPWEVSPPEPQE